MPAPRGILPLFALLQVAAPMSTVASVGAPGRALANLAVVEGLEPKRLWSLFARLSAIPRMSKREAAALELVEALARERGLPFTQDGAGNALIKFPGAGAGIGAPPVLIQGHLDMVTEKNDATAHDFATDPIALVLSADGRWLKADGTTLGADNGIGVCAALALLDEPAPIDLPPLELLFTVDEETGLNGAKALDPAALGVSARTLLNLDTEEWCVQHPTRARLCAALARSRPRPRTADAPVHDVAPPHGPPHAPRVCRARAPGVASTSAARVEVTLGSRCRLLASRPRTPRRRLRAGSCACKGCSGAIRVSA